MSTERETNQSLIFPIVFLVVIAMVACMGLCCYTVNHITNKFMDQTKILGGN